MEIEILNKRFCDYSQFIKGYTPDTIKRYKTSIEYFSRVANVSEIRQVNDENVRNFFYYGQTTKNWEPNSFITYHKSL
jgi:site-specific recombinase XerD